ncbi:vacuolar protein sorting-associated protein [Verticillium alfalfae VaMs.102]|uniref:Vacuolar protein sorting-associated protein n=1 Tax=Verticillium alfalfae (strain VaMs.102 / ATCC MYA-4576 / FGSC 10136) TaxID=526221 RepID=C9SPB9_VERA1|nr:vacuolar protein sorting-associated protein [Verticillium alfalfae VaMs.102]EEY20634.1 vacuolar protein sorting-associated protein [Verticillium alfalfae VaMs.102]
MEGSGNSASKPSSSVKLVLLGEAAVGKSSLVLRFVNNDFQENKEPTIGGRRTPAPHAPQPAVPLLTMTSHQPPSSHKSGTCRPGRSSLKIWDPAGQEPSPCWRPAETLGRRAAAPGSPGIVIALVGNKLDLTNDGGAGSAGGLGDAGDDGADGEADGNDASGDARKVSTDEAKTYADEESLLFFETSAKTGHNVADVFTAIANAIPETSLKSTRGPGAANAVSRGGEEQRVNLNQRDAAAKDSCAC